MLAQAPNYLLKLGRIIGLCGKRAGSRLRGFAMHVGLQAQGAQRAPPDAPCWATISLLGFLLFALEAIAAVENDRWKNWCAAPERCFVSEGQAPQEIPRPTESGTLCAITHCCPASAQMQEKETRCPSMPHHSSLGCHFLPRPGRPAAFTACPTSAPPHVPFAQRSWDALKGAGQTEARQQKMFLRGIHHSRVLHQTAWRGEAVLFSSGVADSTSFGAGREGRQGSG